MKMKKVILSCLLALGFVSASAQEAKTEYTFNPHWYGQLQVGGQYTLGEIGFTDLLSPNVQLGVGYQFSPVVGARLSVNGWQSKAGSEIDNREFNWTWKYLSPMVDVTFNLSNLVAGFNPERLFNLSIFGGLGVNYGWNNEEAVNSSAQMRGLHPYALGHQPLQYVWDGSKVRFAGRFGAQADFRLSDCLSLGVEVSANTLTDKYNSKKANNWDWYFNALVGVKYNFGKTYTKTVIPPTPVRVDTVYIEKEVRVEVPAAAPVVEPLRRDIFFLINKSNIRDSEAQKVKDIADYMTKHPASKVVITGYADAGTGNDRINDRLAAQRADAVVKALKEQYGIAASRISYDSKGSRVQPFAENDMNRVSICIAE